MLMELVLQVMGLLNEKVTMARKEEGFELRL
jgi:hypothetical protein